MDLPNLEMDEYLTVARPGRSQLRVRASRFFGFAERISDEDDAAQMRSRLKQEYHDASHQPYAFRLVGGTVRCSDDGEPPGTSGASILKEIERLGLYNVQVVAVRYFGGAKLGKGNLARAFADCARLVLEDAGILKNSLRRTLEITAPVADVQRIKRLMLEFGAELTGLIYDLQTRLRFDVPSSRFAECRSRLQSRFTGVVILNNNE
ncbi:MAG: YigZ family protein [bacterium]